MIGATTFQEPFMFRHLRTFVVPAGLSIVLACGDDGVSPGRVTLFGCASGRIYTIGSEVNGSIAASDCQFPGEVVHVDFYQFTLEEAGPVTLNLTTSGETLLLILVDDSENLIALDDAEPGSAAVVSMSELPAGDYVIVVGPEDETVTGVSYTLSSSHQGPPPFFGCTTTQSIAVGGSVDGALATTDCVVLGGLYMDRYTFSLASTQTVTITLTSTAIDSYLYLFDAAGVAIDANDDVAPGNFNSEIVTTLPAGTYSIGATSYDPGEVGAYTVAVN